LAAGLAGLAEQAAEARTAAAAALRDAEGAANVQAAFLANVSHELRTPLNGVIGLLSLLAEQPLSSQQRGYVQSAQSSAENLLELVNDLLDITQLEAGKISLRIEAVDLKALLSEVAAAVAPRAAQHENMLRWDVQSDTPARVLADGEKLRRILLNLAGNAVKFTKGGEISLRAFIAGAADDGALLLRLEVEDNGVGISPDHKDQLFQRFYQVDQSATRNHDGSGLGLAICRALCQLMRGRIGVDSAPGVGSRFWVETPVVAAADRAPLTPSPALRILIVDDIALNRALLSEILKTHGCKPLEAADAAAALDLLETGDVCDAVLMDIEMPVMDGCEATRRIRALPAPAGALPVVAITANVDADARRRFAECGIDDWAAKPAGWPDIAAALLRAREAARRRASGGDF
nr:ATP-binding protein [Azospirillaceae bacterium]